MRAPPLRQRNGEAEDKAEGPGSRALDASKDRTMARDAQPRTRRLRLEHGSLVVLYPDGSNDRSPRVMAVDGVRDGQHWFRGSIAPLREGEPLLIEMPVPDDARYAARARIVTVLGSRFALEIEEEWARVQQREYVRVSTYGLPVRLVRVTEDRILAENDDPRVEGYVYELLDLSAGGIRFHCEDDYEADEQVVCHFELPESLCFVLPGRIIRPPEQAGAGPAKPGVAVAFTGLDEHTRSQLLRWIYHEQVRRHRRKTREPESQDVPAEPHGPQETTGRRR
jgi:hypothetical protein